VAIREPTAYPRETADGQQRGMREES